MLGGVDSRGYVVIIMYMTATQTAKMIARRTRKGYNAAQSVELLNELIAAHNGTNLAYALKYNDFTA